MGGKVKTSALALLIICLCGSLFGGISIKMPTGESVQLYSEYVAIVIGNSDYQYYRKLPGAIKDVEAIAETFEGLGIRVIKKFNLKSSDMITLFNEMVDEYGKDRERALLFYFAGHGETERMAGGRELGYILPVDTPMLQGNPSGFRSKAISMTRVNEFAELIQSKHVLMFFDSCFSGTVFTTRRAAPQIISQKTKEDVRQFITAGAAEETVPDQSIFRATLVDGLSKGYADTNKDNYITGEELGFYLENEVVNYSGGGQHPKYGKIANIALDKGDFVFALKQDAVPITPQQTRPPAYVPPPSLELETRAGAFRMTADDSGSVYVDGVFVETITAILQISKRDLAPGVHQVDFVGSKGILSRQVGVSIGETIDIHFSFRDVGSSLYKLWTELSCDSSASINISGFPDNITFGNYIFASDTDKTYSITISKPDHVTQKMDIRPDVSGKKIKTKLFSNYCGITVTSEPSGAVVSLNGMKLGVTPLTVDPLIGRYPPGEYLISVELKDYFPVSKSAKLSNSIDNNVFVKLDKISSGQFKIKKIDPEISVTLVDDRSKSEIKYKNSLTLYSGGYVLQADRWGYIPRSFKVEVKPNRLSEMPELKLDPIDKGMLRKLGAWKLYRNSSVLAILGTTAAAAVTYYFAENNYNDYMNTMSPSEAQSFRDRYNQLKKYYYVTLGADVFFLANYIFSATKTSSTYKSIDRAYRQYKLGE